MFLSTLQALCQAATAYFILKNKLAFWDIEDKVDDRENKLEKRRAALRLIATQDAQSEADDITTQIAEEKRKFNAIKKEFGN